ncbi:MAG: putative zinc-binding metallopeptidase [Thermoanaerobaculia bacterium]
MHTFEKAPPEARDLLPVRIRELGLRIDGSPVEPYVRKLYDELAVAGIHHFRPPCYLTDEWGCPSEEPIIGIPFYLADVRLGSIENALNDVESEREIMMYLRHEAGHAFNYAYELYRTEEWRELFGPFRRAYREDYRFVPFSRKYVRHIAGWYAQKHPDEDFAETFAVWLTPGSRWREKYAAWPAMAKLQYVDRVATELADTAPVRPLGEADFTVEEMEETIEEFYRANLRDESEEIRDLALDTDLVDMFIGADAAEREDLRPARDLLEEHRREIIDRVTYWTGARRSLVRTLVDALITRVGELGLGAAREKQRAHLLETAVYVTTLAMAYVSRGRFVEH